MDGASDGDTVLVHPGEYLGAAYEDMSFHGKSLVVRSLAGVEQTVIGGESNSLFLNSCFRFESGEGSGAVLEGFTLRYNYNAVYCRASTPQLMSLKFWRNSQGVICEDEAAPFLFGCRFTLNGETLGGPGAALFSDQSSPIVSYCDFTWNAAGFGGAVALINGSWARFTFSEFTENLGVRGGAIYVEESQCSLSDVLLADNTARTVWTSEEQVTARGGAVCCRNGSVEMDRVRLIRNHADEQSAPYTDGAWGGGVYAENSTYVIEDCLLAENRADERGGGIFLTGDSWLHLARSTLCGNASTDEGGGILIEGSGAWLARDIIARSAGGAGIHGMGGSADLHVECSDVVQNEGGEYAGLLTDQTGTNGNISEDPRFCDPDSLDFSLAGDSPCLPAGNDCGVQMGAHGLGCEIGTSSPETAVADFRLSQNFPNPFNPRTEVLFDLPEAARVSLDIFDVSGRRLARLLDDSPRSAGRHRVPWDGRTMGGESAPAGIYVCRLKAGDRIETRKMALVQ